MPKTPKLLDPHEASARVLRGAAYLDIHQPEWRTLIKPETLDLANAESCILGQALGNFWSGLKSLNLTSAHAVKFGLFLTREDDSAGESANWSLLTETWLRYLSDAPLPLMLRPSQLVHRITPS